MALKRKKDQPGIGISKLFQENTPYRAPQGTHRIQTLDILPDPEQPRRLLFKKLYDELFAGEATPTEVLSQWLTEGKKSNAGRNHRQAVEDLEQLATTIEWRDLISPVTLRTVERDSFPPHIRYLIRTGERRWWAHIWLILNDKPVGGNESPETIRALIEEGDANIRADQWIENQARTDLSVVENALGLEAVRAEMSREKPKLVRWGDVEARLGISSNYRLRVINVLKLTDEAVGLIAQHNLPERAVRPLVDKLSAIPDLQLPALLKLIEWRTNGEDSGNKRLTDYIIYLQEKHLGESKSTKKQPRAKQDWVVKFDRSINSFLKSLEKAGDEDLTATRRLLSNNEESLEAVRKLRDRLDRLLEQTDSSR